MTEHPGPYAGKRAGYYICTWLLIGMLSLLFAACSNYNPGSSGAKNSTNPAVSDAGTGPQLPIDNWSTYQGNNGRTGFDSLKGLSQANFSHEKVLWQDKSNSAISVQPVIVNGVIYWGSWDGVHLPSTRRKEPFMSALPNMTHASSQSLIRQLCSNSVLLISTSLAHGRCHVLFRRITAISARRQRFLRQISTER